MISTCISDMKEAAVSGKLSLSAQVRAYDLLQTISGGEVPSSCREAAETFCRVYEDLAERIEASFDAGALEEELEQVTAPLRHSLNEARFEAAAAAGLHEFAKETFDIWQNGGIFARRRALRELRERAGFRLESRRIGNYVAKTFDLMNEAQVRFATAQQRLFAANVRFKISPGLHSRVAELLSPKS